MANSDPQSPEEPRPSNTGEPQSPNPEGAPDPNGTDAAFFEIISELSDLSTDQPNDETLRSENTENSLSFPRAPWVDPYFSEADHSDSQHADNLSSFHGSGAPGPRDWSDDLSTLEDVDRFIPPDPHFELSHDPARNLGWFLVGFSLIASLVVFLFMRPLNELTLGILGVLLVCGIGLLVWRMPQHRGDDDFDSGAKL